jgi:hypothetical protein
MSPPRLGASSERPLRGRGAPIPETRSLYRVVEPVRAVQVRDGYVWHAGLLRAWRREHGRWVAFVNVTKRPGETYVRWVAATHVRPLEG